MRVLVTGAAGAIGAATAVELTTRGHHVVATARDPSLLATLDVAQRLALDVTDDASVRAAHRAAGEVDAVVNNAAVTAYGPLESLPAGLFTRVLETNVVGPLRVLQPVLAGWRHRGHGTVVNVSSVQGHVGTPLEGAYAASKHALEALSESLHYELGHFGIRVVIVEPGFVAPGMKPSPAYPFPAEYQPLARQWAAGVDLLAGPDGRPGPESVAAAVADALEDPETPLRVEIGGDARLVLATRRALGDGEFERAMRQALRIDW